MAAESTGTVQTPLTADDAFSVLGSDTRIGILQALGNAQDPRSFSELRTAVGIVDSDQFNYHLDKLKSRIVAQTDAGFRLLDFGSSRGRSDLPWRPAGRTRDWPDPDRTPVHGLRISDRGPGHVGVDYLLLHVVSERVR